MRRFLVALRFLTRLPTPRIASDAADFAGAMRWFPAAGLVVGMVVAAAGWAGLRIDAWTGALAALVAWVAVTGALHLDGLGDVADALGAAHADPVRLRAVLADPHVGSFGVVAIALQLCAKLVLLHSALSLGPAWWIVPVPLVARIGPLVWTRWLSPLHEGLGARFADAVTVADLMLWTVVALAAALPVPGLLAGFALVPAWAWWLGRRLGGISGDGHGAGIELVESGLLLAIAGWATWA